MATLEVQVDNKLDQMNWNDDLSKIFKLKYDEITEQMDSNISKTSQIQDVFVDKLSQIKELEELSDMLRNLRPQQARASQNNPTSTSNPKTGLSKSTPSQASVDPFANFAQTTNAILSIEQSKVIIDKIRADLGGDHDLEDKHLQLDSHEPIGSIAKPFTGKLHNGTITIGSIIGNDNVGFIAAASDKTVIHDITLNVNKVKGNNRVGALVGISQGNLINNVINLGEITGIDGVGGIVGQLEGKITECKVEPLDTGNTAIITGNNRVGGLVGQAVADIYRNNVGKIKVTGNNLIGGVCGNNIGLSIEESSSHAEVKGNVAVGGVVGGFESRKGIIERSHSHGTVTGVKNVGGVVGFLDGGLVNSANRSAINTAGETNVGHIIGEQGMNGQTRINTALNKFNTLPNVGKEYVESTKSKLKKIDQAIVRLLEDKLGNLPIPANRKPTGTGIQWTNVE